MTIAISLKVNDGVVLAADSATALVGEMEPGVPTVAYVYNNANKVFNLVKGHPIGLITWGMGSIGPASVATLVKDLRRRMVSTDPEWRVDPEDYSVKDVAGKLRRFMFDEHYQPFVSTLPGDVPYPLGFIVAGYSTNATMAEEFTVVMNRSDCTGPTRLREPSETGLVWNGQPEAITRLVLGFGTALPDALATLGVDAASIEPAVEAMKNQLQVFLVQPAMPIQDAIELAEFLVDVTIKFVRFMPGAPTVGGPIEVAAITKHEGFKWIRRKYYYERSLNPEARGEIAERR